MSVNNLLNRWTKEEEKLLIKFIDYYKDWEEFPYLTVAKDYFKNRTVSAVRSKVARLLAKLPRTYDFSHLDREDIIAVLKFYLAGNSYKAIQEEFEIDSLEETEQLCDFVTKDLRKAMTVYAEEHNIQLKTFTLPKMQQFIKLNRKTDQFSRSALKRVLNG
jgi:hypothetical protein